MLSAERTHLIDTDDLVRHHPTHLLRCLYR
jgi:hypothetical protein